MWSKYQHMKNYKGANFRKTHLTSYNMRKLFIYSFFIHQYCEGNAVSKDGTTYPCPVLSGMLLVWPGFDRVSLLLQLWQLNGPLVPSWLCCSQTESMEKKWITQGLIQTLQLTVSPYLVSCMLLESSRIFSWESFFAASSFSFYRIKEFKLKS